MRRIFFLTFIGVFLLQGTLLACFNPSFKKVIQAVPMACCAKPCAEKTSEHDIENACNKIALQINQINRFIKNTPLSYDSPPVGLVSFSHQPASSFALINALKRNDSLQHRQSVPLYLRSHAFLI